MRNSQERKPLLPKKGRQKTFVNHNPSPFFRDIKRVEKLRENIMRRQLKDNLKGAAYTVSVCIVPVTLTVGGTVVSYYFLLNKYIPQSTKELHERKQKNLNKAIEVATHSAYFTEPLVVGINKTCQDIIPIELTIKRKFDFMALNYKCYVNPFNQFYSDCRNEQHLPESCATPFGSQANYTFCLGNYFDLAAAIPFSNFINDEYDGFSCYNMNPGKAGTIAAGVVGMSFSALVLFYMLILYLLQINKPAKDVLSPENLKELKKLAKTNSSFNDELTLTELSRLLSEHENQLKDKEREMRVEAALDCAKNPESTFPTITKIGEGPFNKIRFFTGLVNDQIGEKQVLESDDDLSNPNFTV
ncbi:MAG: hypothetical protein A3F14_02975 [Gammaproteobacteria bacterium RIFCSPHIGHO2_12_FULL_43_28]|nr:MAG: hypothetical protein A3F14_02975 [Gammaproteobacteria bacterium RIFCSPHIGHO2_12_FULL_43_28]